MLKTTERETTQSCSDTIYLLFAAQPGPGCSWFLKMSLPLPHPLPAAGFPQTGFQANPALNTFHKYEVASTSHFLSLICMTRGTLYKERGKISLLYTLSLRGC